MRAARTNEAPVIAQRPFETSFIIQPVAQWSYVSRPAFGAADCHRDVPPKSSHLRNRTRCAAHKKAGIAQQPQVHKGIFDGSRFPAIE